MSHTCPPQRPCAPAGTQLPLDLCEPADETVETSPAATLPAGEAGPPCAEPAASQSLVVYADAELDDQSGSTSAPSSTDADLFSCIAQADRAAVELWLAARCKDIDSSDCACVDHTRRHYEREALRFILWLHLERCQTLAGATLVDCVAYRAFMTDPSPRQRWCAPRGTPRTSAAWRPFEGPLSDASRRQSMAVLHALFSFLRDQGLISRNPWSGVAPPRVSRPTLDTSRSLSTQQWRAVESTIGQHLVNADRGASRRTIQLAWAVRVLYATGIRLSELVGGCVGNLHWVDLDEASMPQRDVPGGVAQHRGAWCLEVLGKGERTRTVPIPTRLVEELERLIEAPGTTHVGSSQAPQTERSERSRPSDLSGSHVLLERRTRPLLVRWRKGPGDQWHEAGALGAQALYRQLRRFLALVAQTLRRGGRPDDARALERASTHWLRHTHATHAVAGGVPLDVVRSNLGHASLSTTTIYTLPALSRRVVTTQQKFFASLGCENSPSSEA